MTKVARTVRFPPPGYSVQHEARPGTKFWPVPRISFLPSCLPGNCYPSVDANSGNRPAISPRRALGYQERTRTQPSRGRLIISLDVTRDFLSAFSAVILSEWQSVLGGASSSAQGSGVAIRWSSGQWGRGKDGGRSTAIGHEPYS